MKIVQINAYYKNGSTGKICYAISSILNSEKIENYIFYTQNKYLCKNAINYNLGRVYTTIQSIKSKLFGNNGFNSHIITIGLLKKLNQINPDIVHIHNVHAQNINLVILFRYLKRKNIKTVITFHDCWLLTGYCYHFDMIECEKWKNGCNDCDYYKNYSLFYNQSHKNWKRKLELISGVRPYITTPSNWMENIIKESPLLYKSISVIPNGINLDTFKEVSMITDQKKYYVLGVADRWDEKKGIDVFIELSKLLNEKYQIVLVGINKKVQSILPSNIIAVSRTNNQEELAKIYSKADVFVNPTREEVLGLVNIEALACGTPVVTFDTGGSPECINEQTGFVVKKNDINSMASCIRKICESNVFDKSDCMKQAQKFDENKVYIKYLNLYKKIMS